MTVSVAASCATSFAAFLTVPAVLEDLGVQYFADFGTLLGIYREVSWLCPRHSVLNKYEAVGMQDSSCVGLGQALWCLPLGPAHGTFRNQSLQVETVGPHWGAAAPAVVAQLKCWPFL